MSPRLSTLAVAMMVWSGLATLITQASAADKTATPSDRIPDAIARTLPALTDETGFRPLFGKGPNDGWAQCGPGSFTLSNGVATSHGGMGLWWHTNRMFTNFVIRGEWRLDNRESDSGVFVRFKDPEQDPWAAVKSGQEMEIGDDPSGTEATWRTGALYPFQAPTHVPTRPIGEWNAYELIATDQTYIIRINGETVTVWTDPNARATHGYVGLQNYQEGKGSQHRNFRIKDLP